MISIFVVFLIFIINSNSGADFFGYKFSCEITIEETDSSMRKSEAILMFDHKKMGNQIIFQARGLPIFDGKLHFNDEIPCDGVGRVTIPGFSTERLSWSSCECDNVPVLRLLER